MRQARVLGNFIRYRALSNLAQPSGVRKLLDWSIDDFRRYAFGPGLPACLPSRHYPALPALSKWFRKPNNSEKGTELRLDYFEPFGDTIVPIEISTALSDQGTSNFQRNCVPLKLFIESVRQASKHEGATVYLAQCQLQDLPSSLRQDLPTPGIVHAGKGDVYDANLWMGLPPTYTPLHRDPNPNLFIQLSGRKIVRLYPPDVGVSIFTQVHQKLRTRGFTSIRGEEMMHGEERKLLEEEVWNSAEGQKEGWDSHCQVATLDAGEALFIPLGWWHSIKGIGSAINTSVNFWFR